MKLLTHKLQEGGSVLKHLLVNKEIVLDLQTIMVDYDDEDLGAIFLCPLPCSFANFRDTLLSLLHNLHHCKFQIPHHRRFWNLGGEN